MNIYRVKIIISDCETPIRFYYIKTDCLQKAINLCIHYIDQKYNIIEIEAIKLADTYPNVNMLYIFNKMGDLVQKIELTDNFYNI